VHLHPHHFIGSYKGVAHAFQLLQQQGQGAVKGIGALRPGTGMQQQKVARYPTLTANTTVRSLKIDPGGRVDVAAGVVITVTN